MAVARRNFWIALVAASLSLAIVASGCEQKPENMPHTTPGVPEPTNLPAGFGVNNQPDKKPVATKVDKSSKKKGKKTKKPVAKPKPKTKDDS